MRFTPRPTDGLELDIAFMIDQSHNLKGKMEAMVQTIVTAQEIWVKAALVDREELSALQTSCELVKAEETFRGAFWQDVRPDGRGMARDARHTCRTARGAAGERIRGAHHARTRQPASRRRELRIDKDMNNIGQRGEL